MSFSFLVDSDIQIGSDQQSKNKNGITTVDHETFI